MSKQQRFLDALHTGLWLFAAVGMLVVLVTCTPLDEWWAGALQGQSYYPSGDVLIVLGGGDFEDGLMGWDSYLRSVYAVRNFRSGGFRKVIVTGGARSGKPVAADMSDWIRCHGVPAEDILVEINSLSTRQNALNTGRMLNSLPGRKVLLTSDFHMFRARRVFAKLGVEVFPEPIPDVRKRVGSWRHRWSAFFELLMECCKIVYYWLRGWM